MKFACTTIIALACLAMVSADSGYLPKAFYKLTSNGERGHVYFINPSHQDHLLRRLKRQSGFVSSSSSSSSSDGGPVFFQQSSINSASPGLQSRFGGAPAGVYQQSSGIIDPITGKLYLTSNRSGHL